jgi:F0F1-type ATP synthase gamma subunit
MVAKSMSDHVLLHVLAGDMIINLQLIFNRTRQAVITRELIEIISGAAAL